VRRDEDKTETSDKIVFELEEVWAITHRKQVRRNARCALQNPNRHNTNASRQSANVNRHSANPNRQKTNFDWQRQIFHGETANRSNISETVRKAEQTTDLWSDVVKRDLIPMIKNIRITAESVQIDLPTFTNIREELDKQQNTRLNSNQNLDDEGWILVTKKNRRKNQSCKSASEKSNRVIL
jgi:hypothetical protein